MEAQPPSDVLGGCAFKIRKDFFYSYSVFISSRPLHNQVTTYFAKEHFVGS